MIVLHCKKPIAKIIFFFIFIFVSHAWPLYGNPLNLKDKNAKNEKIYISSDKLIANELEKYAEFIGNVRATQGNTVITSDKIRIYYGKSVENKDGKEKGSNMAGAVRKIVATGNVKIKFDDMEGEANEAIYTTKNRTVILNGPGAKIIKKGSGQTQSDKIIINRENGRIRFEGNVKGEFFAGDKGLN